jgi:hypothetical protein
MDTIFVISQAYLRLSKHKLHRIRRINFTFQQHHDSQYTKPSLIRLQLILI